VRDDRQEVPVTTMNEMVEEFLNRLPELPRAAVRQQLERFVRLTAFDLLTEIEQKLPFWRFALKRGAKELLKNYRDDKFLLVIDNFLEHCPKTIVVSAWAKTRDEMLADPIYQNLRPQ
jgi:hypothetical protein